ncbi:hypothetical protein [Mangrovimonas sp. ST2L15]|uniref:hypothetical protein n=1 Tax=Mangrovimonas sp. ST2L15 TaxID=1645916 RepID=UPI000A588E53|nr:hypothetical protein [Mangrovimonas sp. ST2L15]
MKLIIWSFLFFIGFTAISYSQSNSKKIANYICLTPTMLDQQMAQKKYELDLPENWCAYLGFHDILSFSPKTVFRLDENYYQNYLTVACYDNATYKSNDVEESLKKHVFGLKGGSIYNPKISSAEHGIYGKYYIIHQNSIQQGEKVVRLKVLFNYLGQDYILSYQVLSSNFDKSLDDINAIIDSFKIKE